MKYVIPTSLRRPEERFAARQMAELIVKGRPPAHARADDAAAHQEGGADRNGRPADSSSL